MGHGGWREGAGRKGWRLKVEDRRSIDVRQWSRDGLLTPGQSGLWQWRDEGTGAPLDGVAWVAHRDAVEVGSINRDGRPVRQSVPILRTPCPFGGTRPWFCCPTCGRAVALLYLMPFGLDCRRCAGLAYRAQCESKAQRAWRRQWGSAWTR